MEKSRSSKIFKIVMTILFAGLILGTMIWLTLKGDLDRPYLTYGCVGASFLFALIFIGKSASKLLLTLALGTAVAADYFLIFANSGLADPTAYAQNQLIGLCIFCGLQFVLMVYTLLLNKGNGTRIVNIATRIALCLIAYFVIPLYFSLGTIEMIAVMYIINFAVSLFMVAVHIKTQWLLFLGMLLFFACDIIIGLTLGAGLLGISTNVVDFLVRYNIQFYCYIPGLFLIATHSAWCRKKEQN